MKSKPPKNKIVQKAIRASLPKAVIAAGSQAKLAAKIGATQGHVSKWLERGHLPAEFVLPIEKATGVSRHDLRPDLYPREEVAA